MEFTESSVVDLPVRNDVLSFQQDNGSMHVETTVWPCSLVLVKFVDWWASSTLTTTNPYSSLLDFGGKRAVELDCGCSVAGMGLYLLGLTNMILTDISPVMPALKHNLKRNKPVLNKILKYTILYWNNQDQIRAALNPPFDVVIAADVVYIEETVEPLISAMQALVADIGVVFLGYQLRSPEDDKLLWELSEHIFYINQVSHEDLYSDYAYEEADVYIMRKKKKSINTIPKTTPIK